MNFKVENRVAQYEIRRATKLYGIPHLHTHIEIIYILSGFCEVTVDGVAESMGEGDLCIAFPNQIHSYRNIIKPDAYVFIISSELCNEFSNIFKNFVPKNSVFKNAADNPVIKWAVNNIFESSVNYNEFAETEIRGSTLVLLSELFRNMELKDNEAGDNTLFKGIIDYCYKNYTQDISLESTAAALHVSNYYISRIFSKRLKISFKEYINSLRIQTACELLRKSDLSITEIASEVGYNTIRSFNRCFMNIKKMTPREYRSKAGSGRK